MMGFNPKSVAAMLENIVYFELRRKGYDVYIGKNATKEIFGRETGTGVRGKMPNIDRNYGFFENRTACFAESDASRCGHHV